jgi:hypothetical protein
MLQSLAAESKEHAMKRTAVLASLALALVVTACNQNTLATLVTTLGNASASIAALEGNTALAATLKADTAAATTAVLNWKSGTPTQNVIQALNLVEADLNLIPSISQYAALVDLAIGTVESIIEIVQPGASSIDSVNTRPGVTHRVYLANAPKNAAQFKAAWQAKIDANPALAKAAIR